MKRIFLSLFIISALLSINISNSSELIKPKNVLKIICNNKLKIGGILILGCLAYNYFSKSKGHPKDSAKPSFKVCISCENKIRDGFYCSNCIEMQEKRKADQSFKKCIACKGIVRSGEYCDSCMESIDKQRSDIKLYYCNQCSYRGELNYNACAICGSRDLSE